jgi:hypothetical protein
MCEIVCGGAERQPALRLWTAGLREGARQPREAEPEQHAADRGEESAADVDAVAWPSELGSRKTPDAIVAATTRAVAIQNPNRLPERGAAPTARFLGIDPAPC